MSLLDLVSLVVLVYQIIYRRKYVFDDPKVFDDLKIISNASIDFNDPTDFDDPQMFGSKGTTIGSIDLIIFDGLVDVVEVRNRRDGPGGFPPERGGDLSPV